MAGLTINPADIAKARESGYSDTEIADFLSQRAPDQFKAAREAGYSDKEILSHLNGDDNKPSGIIAGAREGIANTMHGAAETLKQFAGVDNALGAEKASQTVAPENYKGTNVVPSETWYDPRTYNYSQIPQAVAEAAPGIVTDLAAAKAATMATKKPLAGLGAGIASYLLRTRGDAAKNDAVIRTGKADAEPEAQDKARSLITGALESVPQAVGVGRFLPGGKVAQTAGQALAKLGITGLAEGGAGAASNAISQAGATIGTQEGLKFDKGQIVSSGIAQGLSGTALATPRLASDVASARKYAPFTGDNHEATTALMGRVNTALDGQNVTTKTSYEALRTADEGVRDELKAAVKPVKDTLDSDTRDALKRASKGRPLTDSDLQNISDNTTPDIAFLARQAHVASMVKGLGDYGQGQFVGGMANVVGRHIRAIQNPAGAAASAALGAAGLGGHAASLFAYGPATLAAIGGGYLGMRGIDALTGNRTPLQGVLDRFSNPRAQVRLPAPEAPAAPAPAPVSPTGPKVGFNPGVANGGTMLAMGQSPWSENPNAPTPPKVMTPAEMNEQVKSALLMAAARRNVAAQQAPSPAPAMDANGMNTQIKAALEGYSARQKWAARRNAHDMGEDSPLVQDNGGVDLLGQQHLGKEMSALVSAARARAALLRQPEEEGPAPAPPQGPTSPPMSPTGSPPLAPTEPTGMPPAAPSGSPAPSEPTGGPSVDPVMLAQKALKKISKKSGEKAPQPDPQAFEHAYVPLTDEQLYGKGMADEDFAKMELNRELSRGKDIQNHEGYMDSIVHDRQKRRSLIGDIMGEITDGNEGDHDIAAKLLEDLHHTRRAATAHAAIQHYTHLMKDKILAESIRKRLDRSYINSTWMN